MMGQRRGGHVRAPGHMASVMKETCGGDCEVLSAPLSPPQFAGTPRLLVAIAHAASSLVERRSPLAKNSSIESW
jgi:hypothetical protein